MVKLESNAKEFIERLGKLTEKATYELSSQILADSNKHVRAHRWTLRDSSLAKSDPAKGLLVWDTPYAKRVYFTGTPSTDENPDAELMWVHVARDRYGKDWLAMFESLARKEVLK